MTHPTNPRLLLAAITLAALVVAGCGTDSSSEPFSGSSTDVAQDTWTDGAWPFTVPRGILGCTVPDQVTFNVDGTVYGVNGTALSHGLLPVDPVWQGEGDQRASLGPVIQKGLTLCQPPPT